MIAKLHNNTSRTNVNNSGKYYFTILNGWNYVCSGIKLNSTKNVSIFLRFDFLIPTFLNCQKNRVITVITRVFL